MLPFAFVPQEAVLLVDLVKNRFNSPHLIHNELVLHVGLLSVKDFALLVLLPDGFDTKLDRPGK